MNWCCRKALLHRGADHTNIGFLNNLAMDNACYTLCAQHTSASLQALSEKRARASLSGHSSLMALFSLALAMEGQWGLRLLCQHYPVVRVGIRVSKHRRG